MSVLKTFASKVLDFIKVKVAMKEALKVGTGDFYQAYIFSKR